MSVIPSWSEQKAHLAEGPSVLIFRHAPRQELDYVSMGYDDVLNLQLTAKGRSDALAMGAELAAAFSKAGLRVSFALSSPLQRCKDTLYLVLRGLGEEMEIQSSDVLYLKDLLAKEATEALMATRDAGWNDVAKGTMAIGPKSPREVADEVLKVALGELCKADPSSVGLVATHDVALVLLLVRLFGAEDVLGELWPRQLETMLITKTSQKSFRALWRGEQREFEFEL